MITVKEAREQALSFLSQQGMNYGFVDNVSMKIDDAEILINLIRKQNPRKILEIGTFVGVSSAMLGLCLPETEIVCIDPNLPVELEDILCIKKFHIQNPRTTLEYVEMLLKQLGIFSRFTLKAGFFSCCFPNQEDLDKVVNYGFKFDDHKIVGPEVCEEYGPFDLAFLDGDHRTEAVKQDLTLLANHIRPGGMIILHDVGERYYWGQEVRRGVKQFLKENPEKELQVEGEIGFILI